MGHTYPLPLVKALWAHSGNFCYGDECNERLSDRNQTKRVLGEIAHICSGRPDGPRYDPTVDPDTYDNLIVLCPTCHVKIDQTERDSYPPDRLREMKARHEAAYDGGDWEDAELSRVASLAITVARLEDAFREFGITPNVDELPLLHRTVEEQAAAANVVIPDGTATERTTAHAGSMVVTPGGDDPAADTEPIQVSDGDGGTATDASRWAVDIQNETVDGDAVEQVLRDLEEADAEQRQERDLEAYRSSGDAAEDLRREAEKDGEDAFDDDQGDEVEDRVADLSAVGDEYGPGDD